MLCTLGEDKAGWEEQGLVGDAVPRETEPGAVELF